MASPAFLRALAHAPFRVYFAGQAVSILGTWIQQVALAWLVYRLTGSSLLLGLSAFCALVPQLVVGPLAGAWIDRKDKRRWLMGVQAVLAVQAFVLAALTQAGWVTPALIVAMSLLLGVLNSFDTPLRQSLIASFVRRREDLPNALALNAMLYNSGRFIGPPLAGLLLGTSSEATCFALNGLSFAGLIAGMAWLRGTDPPPRAHGSMGQVFREGLRYAWHTWAVRRLILMLAMLNATASAYAVLLPVFAREVFGGDARTLGWLWGAAGAGAFASTLVMAAGHPVKRLPGVVLGGIAVSALGLAGFAATPVLAIALPSIAAVGFGISLTNLATSTLLQSMAPEALRGRVVSFFSSTRFGFDALGGLAAGALAARWSAAAALLGEAVVLAAALACFWNARRRLGSEVSARLQDRAGSGQQAP